MTNVILFPDRTTQRVADNQNPVEGEVIIFPGVRVEYHDDPATVDLSCRIRAQSAQTKT